MNVQATCVAYLIASHRLPGQLLRLLRVIRAETPHAVLAVHHDRFSSPTPHRELAAVGNIEVIEATAPLRWGDYSMVRLVLDSLSELERRGVRYDWLNLISGQDYPIQPLPALEAFLAASPNDAFFEAEPWDKIWPRVNEERYFFQWYRLPDIPIPYRLRRMCERSRNVRLMYGRVGTLLGIRARTLPFDREICVRSSMWWTISRRAVDSLLAAQRNRPDFFSFYKRTLIPDESCLQTWLLSDASLRCRRDTNLRCIFWPNTPTPDSPEILRLEDFDRIRSSQAFFARKFDPLVDEAIGDALDELRQESMRASFSSLFR
jgi:hypothetical protein